jgi:amino acid adenylation domain-containing protein
LRGSTPESSDLHDALFAEAKRTFDLAKSCARAMLIELGPRDHVLALTVHHIACDGRSVDILIGELATMYRHRVNGTALETPIPLQYIDYANSRRDELHDEAVARDLAHWCDRLRDCGELDLPTDFSRPASPSFRGAEVGLTLPREDYRPLLALAHDSRCTPFMVLAAGVVALLAKYTGKTDISVGLPVSGRVRRELESAVGFFVNTLVLRVDASPDVTFRQLLLRVRDATLDALSHQEVPFERIVEVLNPIRDPSRSPLFQILIVSQDDQPRDLDFGPSTHATRMPTPNPYAKFDMTFTLRPQTESASVVLGYSADLYIGSTMQRALGHYAELLRRVASNPDMLLKNLSILSDAERARLLVDWNATEMAFPSDRCIHELFEQQVRERPSATALVFQGAVFSYRELNQRANALAWRLREFGVGPEVAVGICVPRSAEMVIAVLAVLKVGGAYVPLEPDYPAERLAFMLRDSGAKLLLTTRDLIERVGTVDATLLALDEPTSVGEFVVDLPRRAAPGNLAYILYTSGSTGRPKGVAITHRAVVSYCYAFMARLPPLDNPVWAWVQPLSVDSSVSALIPPLISGGTCHVVARDVALDGAALGDYFEKHKIDCLKIAPSHLEALHRASANTIMPRRVLVVGGESSRWEWLRQLREDSGCAVFNHYGPTETTVGVTMSTVDEERPPHAVSAIGRPLGNCRAYIVDEDLEPRPVGIAGDLLIGGSQVARGYIGKPGPTAESFIPDPFGQPGGRLYRTGDVARFLESGQIEFLGRRDLQAKIRGYRIEMGEVESALTRHPAVGTALVTTKADSRGQLQLCAYVVPSGPELQLAALRPFLRSILPDHMIPSFFVSLPSLPMTPHGKVDLSALPELAIEENPAPVPAHQSTPVEEAVLRVWQDVLGRQGLMPTDDFFEVGGHSLAAMQVNARLRQLFRVDLPLQALFEETTAAELAALLDTQSSETEPSSSPDA